MRQQQTIKNKVTHEALAVQSSIQMKIRHQDVWDLSDVAGTGTPSEDDAGRRRESAGDSADAGRRNTMQETARKDIQRSEWQKNCSRSEAPWINIF